MQPLTNNRKEHKLMRKGNKKMQYITAGNVINAANKIEGAIREANKTLAQEESDLTQTQTPQAYNFAYKAYETNFENIQSRFQDIEKQVIGLEAKLHLLNGIPKITVVQRFKKIKKLISEQLSKPKIPKREVE